MKTGSNTTTMTTAVTSSRSSSRRRRRRRRPRSRKPGRKKLHLFSHCRRPRCSKSEEFCYSIFLVFFSFFQTSARLSREKVPAARRDSKGMSDSIMTSRASERANACEQILVVPARSVLGARTVAINKQCCRGACARRGTEERGEGLCRVAAAQEAALA